MKQIGESEREREREQVRCQNVGNDSTNWPDYSFEELTCFSVTKTSWLRELTFQLFFAS